MATGTASARPVPPPAPLSGQSASNQRYIEQQLRRTSMQVRIVDLFGGLMLLAAGCLLFVLTVAVVDAWIYELGSIGRFLALVVTVGFIVTYLVMYVAPLFYRRINPEYAARVIEDAEPTLKNSLINFLTFRSNRTAAHEVVQQALEQRAAADLSHVPIESAVDRSKVIRVGYVLAAIVLICGLYKILSPKDPFQTFARIASPFSQISRPARVRIDEVKPGNVEIFRGAVVDVTATIDGLAADDTVQLLYSTEDGQAIDATVEMTAVDSSRRDFACKLRTSDEGIQQTLNYQVVAGDASSKFFRLTVLAAPTIVVESVEYNYPAYTKRPNHTVARQGDLRALEGTRARIHCRANHKIKAAWLELMPSAGSLGKAEAVRPKTIPMDSKEFEANGDILLELSADGRTPIYQNYQVRFKTEDGHLNERPSLHKIEVIPDLAPEVQILKPTTDVIEVPENSKTSIEVRAIDPDYGLSSIDLVFTDLPNQNLFSDPNGRTGQVIVNHEFVPLALGLSAGDTVTYFAQASDNQTTADGRPAPNVKRTDFDYIIKITVPEKRAGTTSRDETPPDDVTDDRGSDTERGKTDIDPSTKPKDGSPSDKTSDSGGSESGEGGDTKKPMSGDGTAGSTSDPGEASDSPSGSDSSGSKSAGTNSTGEGGGKSGESSETESGSSSRGAEGGEARSESDDGTKSDGGSSSKDGASGKGGETSNEPLHDGEKFERILDHIKKKNEEKNGGGSAGEKSDSAADGGGKSGEDTKDGASDATAEKKANGNIAQPGNEKPGDNSGSPDKQSGTDSAGNKSDPMNGGGSKDGSGQPMSDGDSGKPSGNPGQQPNGAQPDGAQSGAGQEKNGGQDSAGNKDGQNSGGANASDNGQPSGSKPDGGQSASGGQPMPGSQSSEKKDGGQSGGGEKPSDMGGQKSGGQPSGGGQQDSQQSGSKSGGEQPKSGGQESGGQKKDGNSSGGGESEKQGGAPKPQDGNNKGGGQPKPGGQKQGGESKSPGAGKQSSGAEGQNEGDKSGAGGPGGGQNSGQSGNDSGGGTNPSDQGDGVSNEKGPGETSQRPGGEQPAGQKTGSKGTEPGAGSSSSSDPSGRSTADSAGDKTGRKSGSPFGGGGTGDGELTDVPDSEVADGDEANLEYAKKVTDLALDYLKDQKSKPDRELLDDLKMTEEELRGFTERYDRLMRNAEKKGLDGKRELDDSLRSLGLRPGGDKRRSRTTPDDLFKDHADGGQSSRPPAKYADDFNAANKGINRSGNNK